MKRKLIIDGKESSAADKYDRAEYLKDAHSFFQEELTYEKMITVSKLLRSDIETETGKLHEQFEEMNLNIGKDKLIKILAVSTGLDEADLIKFKLSELKTLREDFFFLNAELTKELASLSVAAALAIQTRTLKTLESISKAYRLPGSKELQKTSISGSAEKISPKLKKQKKSSSATS